MRFRAERDDLADALSRAGRAVGTKSPLPVLQGVLCSVESGNLRVTGTDTEITIQTSLPVEAIEEGKTAVPAKLAADAVRKLPAGAVSVSASNGEVEIQGNGPRFRLRELNVQDYPHIEWAEPTGGIKIFGRDFLPAVSRVGVASATDEARPTLTGVLFESQDDALRLVATDSYRLAVCQIPGSPGVATTLVPFRALRELNRTIGDDNMALNLREREAVFSSPRGALSARVIEADFPNYRQLLPESYPNKIVLDKGSLLEALGRASLVAEEHIPVRLTLHSGGVELSVSRQEVGEETEHLDGVYTGEDMTIAFNTKYLTDGVAAVTSDDVVLEASDPLKPGLITGEGDGSFRYLLMPVRL